MLIFSFSADEAEIKHHQVSQALANKESQNIEELRLMSSKIEDLTVKYLAAEKQVRSLKLKLKNVDGSSGKERRRSSTGIKPDELLVGREAEHVLEDIELCLANMECYIGRGKEATSSSLLGRANESSYRRKSYETSTKASRARRKSSELTGFATTGGDASFVDRLKRTERTISDINRKLSAHHGGSGGGAGGLQSSAHLDQLRKQMLALVNRTRDELAGGGHMNADLADMLTCLESAVATMDLPPDGEALGSEPPGFPRATEDLSSHVDTIMSFLYQAVERIYEMRKDATTSGDVAAVVTAGKAGSLYELGAAVVNGGELARLIRAQEACLQVCLLMDLQQRVATIESHCVAYSRHRDQTLIKSYSDMTKSLLLRLLESKQFVPLSAHSHKKLKALSSLPLTDFSALGVVFRRLKAEAQSVFARIGSLTSELVLVLTDAVACELSDKQTVMENIRSEVFSFLEEDERKREFQSSLVNIYLISSSADEETGDLAGGVISCCRDPERLSLMANWDEALQSQAEVTRILVEQEFQELGTALELKLESSLGSSCDFPIVPHRESSTVSSLSGENLCEAVAKIANMVTQKCVTEAQITILRTILGLEDEEEAELLEEEEEDGGIHANSFVFNPENMNNECNEFMLVLNNYRQQQECQQSGSNSRSRSSSRWGGQSPPTRLSLGGGGGEGSSAAAAISLETNLRNIRQENENKKARLSAALDLRRANVVGSCDVTSPTSAPTTPLVEQERLQDLRTWCEKSMTAMERSYENLLGELQLQHNREKMSLRREKDQALAEETRATLAALDAMRKAHESEVQKEVEKFKKEFLQEVRSKECIGALQSEFQEDRAVIRREILSVTGGSESGSQAWDTEEAAAEETTTSCRRPLPRLTRSPSCPRLYSGMSFSAPSSNSNSGGGGGVASRSSRRLAEVDDAENVGAVVDEPIKSPLTGMVANRKRVFENEY